MVNLCCFNLLGLWKLVTAAIGNLHNKFLFKSQKKMIIKVILQEMFRNHSYNVNQQPSEEEKVEELGGGLTQSFPTKNCRKCP